MKRKTMLSMAWENMKQRKLRTSLTTLSVVIGIMAIISLTSLGEGFRTSVTSQILQLELDVVMVSPSGALTGSNLTKFTEENTTNIKNNIAEVKTATLVTLGPFLQVYNEEKNMNATTFAALGVNFTEFKEIYPERFIFEEGDLPQSIGDNPIILGYQVAHQEGEVLAAVNDTVKLMMSSRLIPIDFTVVGLLEESGAGTLISLDTCVLIPLSTAEQIYGSTLPNMIFVKVTDQMYVEAVADEIKALFQNQVTTLAPSIMLQRVGNIMDIAELFLAGIGSIALLVAGVGIMNIMTVSVMERTREIGILKAIGAKNRHILTMFLAEAALIGLVGGLLGVPTGYGLAQVLSCALSAFRPQAQSGSNLPLGQSGKTSLTITPVLSPLWVVGAVAFGITVSILFGWYPARKAAKLDPVQALRHE